MSRLVRRILLAVLVLCGTFFAPERCSGPFCPEIFRVSPVLAPPSARRQYPVLSAGDVL